MAGDRKDEVGCGQVGVSRCKRKVERWFWVAIKDNGALVQVMFQFFLLFLSFACVFLFWSRLFFFHEIWAVSLQGCGDGNGDTVPSHVLSLVHLRSAGGVFFLLFLTWRLPTRAGQFLGWDCAGL